MRGDAELAARRYANASPHIAAAAGLELFEVFGGQRVGRWAEAGSVGSRKYTPRARLGYISSFQGYQISTLTTA
jgi:hypothetical protein